MKENIILIGFMGCGKTTIGKLLKTQMGYTFIDTDVMIELKEGMSVSEIFEHKGEDFFRELESNVLRELAENTEKNVISTGGGLPVREENRRMLRELGTVFYIRVSKEVLIGRLRINNADRPLLQGEDDLEVRVDKMLKARESIYEAAAHFIIDADEKTKQEVTDEIGGIIDDKATGN